MNVLNYFLKIMGMKFRLYKTTIIFVDEKPKVRNPKLIQGLLGVGHVGYLAGKQLIKSLNAKKVAEMYSPDFLYPGAMLPGIVFEKNYIADLSKNEIYYSEKHDIFILSGLYQGVDPRSYFDIANTILDFCDEFNINEIYTIGGYGVNYVPEKPKVFGVVADERAKEILIRENVELLKVPEGVLGVTGLAGILVAMASKNGKLAICLLGETSGTGPDPKAAKAALLTLARILKLGEIDTSDLDRQIKEYERELKETEEYARRMIREFKPSREGEFLPYIG